MNRPHNNPNDPLLGHLERTLQRQLLKDIVGRTMFCPVSGEVLDFRSCVVFVDNDGDPTAVLSQSGWERMKAAAKGADAVRILAGQGYFLDRSSVKEV